MKILIACERSQVLTQAFRNAGHAAYSCDIQPCYGNMPEYHIIANALDILYSERWDMVIAHPPCTYLTKARAAKTFASSKEFLKTLPLIHSAHNFFMEFYNYTLCPRAIENPVPLTIASLPNYTQLINPNQFGDKYSKQTCLWLHDLPPLLPTHAAGETISYVYHVNSTSTRRSHFSQYLANAMVSQWT